MVNIFDYRLIFEKSRKNSFQRCEDISPELARSDLDLPELSEPEVVRHYTMLSYGNFGVDSGIYPLGSCTMKYNPKFMEELAWEEKNNVHPYQSESTIQGSLEILFKLKEFLKYICGMDDFSLQPPAGASGEFAGMSIIKAYFEEKGEDRREVLVPDSAHGTNPKSAAMAGFDVVELPSDERGYIDLKALRSVVSNNTAALMLTNPNTLGIFEKNILEIANIVHGAGGLLFYDGANLNGTLGRARPGDMGFDAMSVNLHKTFATPHGGGGPGGGPIGVKKFLSKYLPLPTIEFDGKYYLDYDRPKSIGKVHGFYGNYLTSVKALGYIIRLGSSGLKRVTDHAVLNSNYVISRLRDVYTIENPEIPRKHEAVFSASKQKSLGANALLIAKRLIDYDVHPPTIYFPQIVKEALMIEPTETESKETLDRFCDALIQINSEIQKNPDIVQEAPHKPIVRRLDEASAARKRILRWRRQGLSK